MHDPEQLNKDCRHVRWDRPCAPHKHRAKVCASCDEYEPIRHRVLMVKLAAVGDVLRTTSFLEAIHEQWPAAHVTWVTKPNARALFDGNRWVDEVWTTDTAITAARLASQRFDVVLSPDADPEAAALAAAANGESRRGFTLDGDGSVRPLSEGAEVWFRMGLSDALKKANQRTYQELVAEVLGLDPSRVTEPVLEPAQEDLEAAREVVRDAAGQQLIGINTGAGGRWAYKQWTLPHQQEFLRQMTSTGAAVLLLGGPEEVERHRKLLSESSGTVIDGGNHNSYARFAALVEQCAAVVTGDTLAVHVAAARKTPAVVLFGPTSAPEIELYGRGEKLVPTDLECVGCYLPICAVEPHCQARIDPATVVAAVQRVCGC